MIRAREGASGRKKELGVCEGGRKRDTTLKHQLFSCNNNGNVTMAAALHTVNIALPWLLSQTHTHYKSVIVLKVNP